MNAMNDSDRDELHDAIIRLCQTYGFTTDHTHELVEEVIGSIATE